MISLSLPLTEASKNRQIVLNAMKALFNDHQQEGALDSSFGEQINALQAEIDQKNIEDYTKYKQLSTQTKEQIGLILQGKGEVDLETSFSESCNTSYANMMQYIDEEVFQEVCDSMLFNQNLPIGFESSVSSFSISESFGAVNGW